MPRCARLPGGRGPKTPATAGRSPGRLRHWLLLLVSLSWVVPASGCATHATRVRNAHEAFFAGDVERAARLLDQSAEKARGGRDCVRLDQAMVHLAGGQSKEAEALLLKVRDRFRYFEQTSVAEQGLAWLTDDNALAYAGTDYENVLIPAFLALADLMHDGGDATAYCLQLEQQQQAISAARRAERLANAPPADAADAHLASAGQPFPTTPELQTVPAEQRVAFGAYLRGVLHEASHLNYDDAERCYALAASWEPGFRDAQADVARARHGVHSQPGNGILYVFTLVGRGPSKETIVAQPSTNALAIAETILLATGHRTLPPLVPPIQVPHVAVPANPLDQIAVMVDGQAAGHTETVTDIGRLAIAHHEATFDRTVARAVARRAAKLAATTAAKQALDVDRHDTGASLALDLVGMLWESSERADTRGWGLLPETIQVRRLELPAGEHSISLYAARQGQPVGPRHTRRIEVSDGRDTYLLACFPGCELVGAIQTSHDRHGASRTASIAAARRPLR